MSGIRDDLLHSWRVYKRTPFQSALAIFTLGVAIAFATAFFSLYSDLGLRAVPGMEDSREVVGLGLSEGDSFDMLRGGMRDILDEQATSLAAVEGYGMSQVEIEAPEHQEGLLAGAVTSGYFDRLGIELAHGRGIDASDEDALVVVLAYELAETLFGEAGAAIHQEIEVAENRWQVIGVTDPDFTGLFRDREKNLWMPRQTLMSEVWGVPEEFFDQIPLQAFARLAPGVSPAAAEQEVRRIAEDFPADIRSQLRGQSIRLAPELSSDPEAYRAAQQQLQLMAGAAVLVALIAAGNLGLFLLARAPARQREMALRMTVGATRGRLVRQLMTESFALVLVGTVIGALLSLWLAVFLQGMPLFDGGRFLEQGLDWRVPLFALLLALLLAGLVGLAPALGMARASLAAHGRDRRYAVGARHLIATGQVLLAVVIVAGGLFAQHSLMAGMALDPGYETQDIQAIEVRPAGDFASFQADQEEIQAFREEIRERLSGAGNVQQVGFAGSRPGSRNLVYEAIHPAEDPEAERAGIVTGWDPEVMDMLGLRLLHGRLPDPEDSEEVVVNRELARSFWGRSEVVGERVQRDHRGWGGGGDQEDDVREIVGVVDDVHFGHPRESLRPMVLSGRGGHFMSDILVQGEIGQTQAEAAIGEFLENHSVPMRIASVDALAEQRDALFAQDRSRALLTGAGAVIVLIMAVLGFYGTLRFLMDSHRFEFALKAALGAGPRRLYRTAMGRGLTLALPGLLLGLPVAMIVVALLSEYLGAIDLGVWPASLLAVLLLGLTLLLAIHPVARQAARRDPGPALRSD